MTDLTRESIELELLLLRCRRGDGAAWKQLIRQFEKPLFYFIRRITDREEDAWDAIQETWIRAFRKIEQVNSGGSLRAWLYRVARSTTLNQIRSEQRYQAAVAKKAESLEGIESRFECDLSAEDVASVHDGLAQLDLPFREVLTLYFLEGFSIAEMAEVLDAPIGTVKSRLHHARKKIRQIIRETND